MKIWFFLLFITTVSAQDKSDKKTILDLCIYITESVKENHLIDNKYQLFIKSNDLFSEIKNVNHFGNPVVFFPANKIINDSHIVFESFEFINQDLAKAKFSYNCKDCNSWNYDMEFEHKDTTWRILQNKTDLNN